MRPLHLQQASLHEPHERQVIFRYQPWGAVAGVDLMGEVESWNTPLPMADVGSGMRELSVMLGPGVYSYKFRHSDDSYHLDPTNSRTVRRGGHQNSVLVVDGTAEPVLHAPCAPFLTVCDGGRVRVRANLRSGHGECLHIRFDEGQGAATRELVRVGSDGEHGLYETYLPCSSERLRYAFVLADGRIVGREGSVPGMFEVDLRGLSSPLPSWWSRGVMYTIFVDRFRKGGQTTWSPLACERDRAGGDLRGVIESLPYLSELGVDILHLTPVALSYSAHRYDAVDCRTVDPALGGESALCELLAKAHTRGMRVMLDLAITHVHRDHVRFRDVRERGPSSPYWEWFHAYRHPFDEGPDGGYIHYPKGQWHEPLLRTTHPDVVEDAIGHFEYFTRLGVDGFRIDAACSLPVGLSRRIRQRVRKLNPEAVVWGEITVDHPERWLGARALDAATDFATQHAERRFLSGEIDAASLCQTAESYGFRRAGEGATAIAFTANHDQARLRSWLANPELARAAHVILLMRSALPALYYGDEVGLASEHQTRNFEDAWPDRAPMEWDADKWDSPTLTLLKDLITLRREQPALQTGDERWLAIRDLSGGLAPDVVGIRRACESQVIDVLLHRGASPCRVALPDGSPSAAEVLLASGDVRLIEGGIELGPFSAVVLARTMHADLRVSFSHALTQAQGCAEHAFVAGRVEIPSLPPRLYLTVTEACNLRCVHCITHAPRLTQEGRARSMSPWVMDKLTDAFRAASYIGFVHGGESLVAPGFWDLLQRIRDARAGGTTRLDMHLLSNGMLLDRDRVDRLIDLGITSIAMSLDGASARTNDRLRVHGKFTRVVQNIEDALALRAKRNVDLRIGISSVVSRSALGEVPELARLCTKLGVDWLKLEEMYGASQQAIEEQVPTNDAGLLEALGKVQEHLSGSAVQFVNHVDELALCACSSDKARAFRAVDDFANRARFRPCRMLWEQAAIDPDGKVRPVDFGHASVGSLLDASLLELWNSAPLRQARALWLSKRTRATRLACLQS